MACKDNPFKGNELSDSDRAHSGVPGSEVRHGADALKRAPKAKYNPPITTTSHSGGPHDMGNDIADWMKD